MKYNRKKKYVIRIHYYTVETHCGNTSITRIVFQYQKGITFVLLKIQELKKRHISCFSTISILYFYYYYLNKTLAERAIGIHSILFAYMILFLNDNKILYVQYMFTLYTTIVVFALYFFLFRLLYYVQAIIMFTV